MHFRKPPFSVSWKRIKVFTSTLVFSQRFPPSTLDHRKRIKTSVLVTSLCSTVFSLHYACLDWNSCSRWDIQRSSRKCFQNLRFHPSTLIRWTSVFKNLHSGKRFRKPPSSIVLVWTEGENGRGRGLKVCLSLCLQNLKIDSTCQILSSKCAYQTHLIPFDTFLDHVYRCNKIFLM